MGWGHPFSHGIITLPIVLLITMRHPAVLLLCLCAGVVVAAPIPPEVDQSALILSGEHVRFDAEERPQFSDSQISNVSAATRVGLVRWAATAQGQELIRYFNAREYEVRVSENESEQGEGRAPQPAIATLMAASDRSTHKGYALIFNPTIRSLPGVRHLTPEPSTPDEIMATAWAAEMLHVYFYSRGISLPHHQRPDFQQRWQVVAAELGFPYLRHDDGDEAARKKPVRRSRTGSGREGRQQ
ncbi:MAG TPA: hypothetical protein VHL58_12650 [Thermoanaerobaculia bacterium]|nr:hypothetical protein [Thermoanaerobaculia bacterium]